MESGMSEELVSWDPATGAEVGRVPVASPEAVQAAVQRARAAQPGWEAHSLEERRAVLQRVADRLVPKIETMGQLLTREQGKPLKEGVGEARTCAKGMRGLLDELVEALAPDEIRDGHTLTVRRRDPYGVAAVITPWNFPIMMPHQLVVAALMAGNAVVVKPSELTPVVAQAWLDAFVAELPEGVLQVVHGADATGKALVASEVDLIAFTGSREVGAKILTAAAGSLKRVILELGGKDPLVVLRDADLDAAARFAVRNSYRNAGQVCVSTERIYVDQAVAEAFEERFVALARGLKVGPGTEEGVDVGPMVSPEQKAKVLQQVAEAKAAGARVLLDGGEGQGNFLPPLALADLTHEHRIMRDETFGPVACLQRFADDDEAVALANDTPFGLGAAVFGEPEHAATVAGRLRAGMIGVNRGCGGASGSPWVGANQSGYGFHSGLEGHRQFAQVRIVSRPAR
jgi:acyl-CoA reductase-like NAD-dependent aldehyde dehydrogenase